MRAISVLSGLTLALAASVLVHAEPKPAGGKPPLSASSVHKFSGGKQCVVAAWVHAESADADDRLILHIGTRAHISHLPAPCDGLMSINRMGTLNLQPHKGRYCAGDSFSIGGGIMGAVGLDPSNDHCTLGSFEQVEEKTLSTEYRR